MAIRGQLTDEQIARSSEAKNAIKQQAKLESDIRLEVRTKAKAWIDESEFEYSLKLYKIVANILEYQLRYLYSKTNKLIAISYDATDLPFKYDIDRVNKYLYHCRCVMDEEGSIRVILNTEQREYLGGL